MENNCSLEQCYVNPEGVTNNDRYDIMNAYHVTSTSQTFFPDDVKNCALWVKKLRRQFAYPGSPS